MTERTQRPLSPHLQVYKPQMTSVLSILHRMTGAANALGLVVFTFWLLAASIGETAYGEFTSFMGSWLGLLVLAGFTFSVSYHLCNGVRHLLWDMGYLFKIENACRAGYAVLAASFLLTAVFWWVVFPATGGQ